MTTGGPIGSGQAPSAMDNMANSAMGMEQKQFAQSVASRKTDEEGGGIQNMLHRPRSAIRQAGGN